MAKAVAITIFSLLVTVQKSSEQMQNPFYSMFKKQSPLDLIQVHPNSEAPADDLSLNALHFTGPLQDPNTNLRGLFPNTRKSKTESTEHHDKGIEFLRENSDDTQEDVVITSVNQRLKELRMPKVMNQENNDNMTSTKDDMRNSFPTHVSPVKFPTNTNIAKDNLHITQTKPQMIEASWNVIAHRRSPSSSHKKREHKLQDNHEHHLDNEQLFLTGGSLIKYPGSPKIKANTNHKDLNRDKTNESQNISWHGDKKNSAKHSKVKSHRLKQINKQKHSRRKRLQHSITHSNKPSNKRHSTKTASLWPYKFMDGLASPVLTKSRTKRAAATFHQELPFSRYDNSRHIPPRSRFFYRRQLNSGHRDGRLLLRQFHSDFGTQSELGDVDNFEEPMFIQQPMSTTTPTTNTTDQRVSHKESERVTPEKVLKVSPEVVNNTETADNSTSGVSINGSIARQLLRSPMLVDYGSRVRPQDVFLPTDPPEPEAESEAEPESEILPDKDTTDPDTQGEPGKPELETEQKEMPENQDNAQSEPEPEEPEPESETIHITPPLPDPIPKTPDLKRTGLENPFADPEVEPGPETEPEVRQESHPGEEPETKEETESETETETESESSSEPEGEQEEPEPEGTVYAEPQPIWEEAKREWGPWWEVHIYGIGLAYSVLCAYSLISIIRLWRKKNLLSQGYFISLNSMMFVLGFVRGLYFLVDGYNSNGTFTPAGHYFLYSIGFPLITSAFSILLFALLNTLKMQVVSPKIQRTSVLVTIILGHFILSISTDIIVGYVYTAKIMMFVCQVSTVLWGILLFVGYIYVFRQLYKAAIWRQNELMRQALARIKLDGITPITRPPRLTLNVALKVTLSTAIFGLILACLQTYGIIEVNSIFSEEVPNAWTWLLYNTGMRLTELCMCITMSYVATQPFRYKQSGKVEDHQSSCVNALFYMAPCRRMFECNSMELYEDDLDYTDFPTHGELDPQDCHITAEESTPMTASGRAAQTAAAIGAVSPTDKESSGGRRSNKVVPRPASLLVSDNGFIRFREEEETGGSPVLLSTDDELESNSVENMLRNPFYRDLLRKQEKDRAVGRATFVNADGITLQDEFGLVETIADQELIPPPRQICPIKSYTNIGTNTPGTPRSFCSTDLDCGASEISYRAPSSIHLRESIENALNIPGFTLKTPDLLDSPVTMAYFRARHGSLASRGSRVTGSMNDLESLKHYGPISKYSVSRDTVDINPSDRAGSPDSMYSYTFSNMTRAPLVRSYSDSIGRTSLPEASCPNSPERQYYKARVQANLLKNNPENHNQFQTLLQNINDMCNVYNKLSPDDREGDE